MDHSAAHEANLAALMTFHAAKRRLAIMSGARVRRGEPTDDLEMELAINRVEATAYAAFILNNPPAYD
jgi:hypothetical protein